MTINGANFTVTATTLCNDGSVQKYFTGGAPAGWTIGALLASINFANPDPVTFAEDATGSGTRYDVYADTDLDAIPWTLLSAGDVINIHHKATPYSRKFGLRAQGTETNPVVINGVTNIAGQRPAFDFNGATTCATCNPGGVTNLFYSYDSNGSTVYTDSSGGIIVTRGSSAFGGYDTYKPEWIEFKNLDLSGAASGNTFTTVVNDTEQTYDVAAGLYLHLVRDCLVENCVITDNGFGIFTQAKDGELSQACERVTFRNNRVYDNGISGSWYEHNFYVQCANPIIEGNYIGQVRAGSLGSSYKSRSSGEIFRYNYVEGSARVCDWVHSEEQEPNGIVSQPDYGTLYVYGNAFVNDHNLPQGGAQNMFHIGGDNLGEDTTSYVDPTTEYLSQCYFWGNTVVYRSAGVDAPWSGAFFDLSIAVGNPSTNQSAPTTVDAWNNIFVVASSGAASSEYAWMEYAGRVNLHGSNVLYGGTVNAAFGAATSGYYDFNNNGALVTGDPALSDIANQDITISNGSSALGNASAPAAMAAVIAAYPIEYQPNNKTNGMTARNTVTALGAYE